MGPLLVVSSAHAQPAVITRAQRAASKVASNITKSHLNPKETVRRHDCFLTRARPDHWNSGAHVGSALKDSKIESCFPQFVANGSSLFESGSIEYRDIPMRNSDRSSSTPSGRSSLIYFTLARPSPLPICASSSVDFASHVESTMSGNLDSSLAILAPQLATAWRQLLGVQLRFP